MDTVKTSMNIEARFGSVISELRNAPDGSIEKTDVYLGGAALLVPIQILVLDKLSMMLFDMMVNHQFNEHERALTSQEYIAVFNPVLVREIDRETGRYGNFAKEYIFFQTDL